MRVISIRIPDWMIELIDTLVEKMIFISRSEFIRYAIRTTLRRYERELRDNNTLRYRIMYKRDKDE